MDPGNVYADLGYGDADEMVIEAQLATKIAEIIKRKGITQTQAAQLLGMPQPKLSNLLRGRFRGFSERRLMDCLTKRGRDVPRARPMMAATLHSALLAKSSGGVFVKQRSTRNGSIAPLSQCHNTR